MNAFRSRLDRLEQARLPTMFGRFVIVRAGQCDDAKARAYLNDNGVNLGRHDLLLVETNVDPGTSGHVAPDEPISHHIIECTERFEDMLAQLD